MLKSKCYKTSLGGVKITNTEWVTNAVVWEIEKGVKPTVALKYIDLQGVAHYVKVNL